MGTKLLKIIDTENCSRFGAVFFVSLRGTLLCHSDEERISPFVYHSTIVTFFDQILQTIFKRKAGRISAAWKFFTKYKIELDVLNNHENFYIYSIVVRNLISFDFVFSPFFDIRMKLNHQKL